MGDSSHLNCSNKETSMTAARMRTEARLDRPSIDIPCKLLNFGFSGAGFRILGFRACLGFWFSFCLGFRV